MKIQKNLYPVIFIIILILIQGCNSSQNESAVRAGRGWEKVGPGGGGAMFWPAVSPHNPDIVCVACDMTGSFITLNGGLSWKMFNLSGPVSFFTFDPVNPDIIYANSIGLFKSADRGNTWSIIYPSPSEIRAVVAKGDHAEEIIVTADSTRREVEALAIDPGNSSKLHAAIRIEGQTGYFTSDDQGDHWKKVIDFRNEVRNIFIDPASPPQERTLFFTFENYVMVLEKGRWLTNKALGGIKKINEYSSGFDSARNKLIIYAISGKSYFNPEGDASGIFYSEDGGRSWENRQNDILRLNIPGASIPEWRTIATSAFNPSTVYVSYSGLTVAADTVCFGVAKSEDCGKTWELSWKDFHSKNGDGFSSNYKKGWIDERFGPGWGENPFSIAVSPENPGICFTTDFGRTIKTSNGGETWEQVYTDEKEGYGWISRGLEVTTGYNVVADPFDKAHLFAANTDIGLLVSHDGGESWNSATMDNGIPRRWMNSTYWLTADPDKKDRWWAAMSNTHDLPRPKMWRRRGVVGYEGGIVSSEDGGKTWNPVSTDIGEAAVTHLFVDPESKRESRTIYACAFGKGLFKSTDGGKTWKLKNNGIEGIEPFTWRISRDDRNGELFLIVCRRSDNGSIGNEYDGAVYRSGDGAESWKKMTLPEGTNGPMSIMSDPDESQRMILSAWGRTSPGPFTPDTGGGIFLTTDNGQTWKQVLSKDQHIHDISYDKRAKTFFACGFNGSAYRSDDRGETWNRLSGYNFKWGKRVEPDPADPDMVYVITFGGGVWHGPATGDNSSAEDILSPAFRK